jgi:hypothetical protein
LAESSDSLYTQGMALAEYKSLCQLLMFPAIFATILVNLISMESYAQDMKETCPCFNYEEVESIFLVGVHLTEEEGMSECSAQDYSVECSAEVIVWDQDYTTIAHARVDWFDYDPGGCKYIDTTRDPHVDRNVRWPHPAPEATAKACFNIISDVIAKSDTSGKCNTFP